MNENLKMKSARAAKDLTQPLAEMLGVSRQTINAIEKDYNPTINLCIKICKVPDKTLNEIR